MTFSRIACHLDGIPTPFDANDFNLDASQLERHYSANGDGEHPALTRVDWRSAVNNEDTAAGYWQWIADELQSAFSELSRNDPEWSLAIIDMRCSYPDEMGSQIAGIAEVIAGNSNDIFGLLWADSSPEQRASFLAKPEVAAQIGAPDVYEAENGWGFVGCESDCYESEQEARLAAALAILADSDSTYSYDVSPAI